MRTQITILLSFLVTVGFSQVRPDQFLEQTNPTNANFEFYSQKGGAPRRATFTNVKKNMVPFVTDTLAGVPTATGNLTNLGEFIWDQYGALWYIDGEGDAVSFTGGGPIYVLPDTTAQTLVYAPSHGLTDTITLYGYVPVKADFTRANSSAVDSSFIAYAIDAPHPDSLLLVFSGLLTYVTWHGKEINTQYYLQDDGSEDTTPGTISIPTAIASDSLTLFLREVGADIAGRLRRIAMPSPLITAFGGNPASPTDAVVQAAIEGTYLPAGLAQPGTVFTLSYATQSYNPTYQQTAPNTNPLTPSYAWLWDGAYATRIVNIPTSVNLQDTSYGVLGTLVLLPIDSLMAASVPTDTEVALWLDTNYTANNLRLANGSLLYFIGDSTRQNPQYIWQVIDDISFDAGDTDWEKILKRLKFPSASEPDSTVFATLYALADTAAAIRGDIPAPDGNGIFDAANDGDTTAVASVVLGQDFTVDMDGNDWLFGGIVEDDTTSRIMALRGDGSLAYRWLDSLLNGYTTGSGTAGTLPIWTGANALGNSSLTESGGNVVGTSFTGAFKLATGTTAQTPVGANGLIRYSTTGNGIQAWNGAAAEWEYLPWADADNWAANRVPFSDGSKLTTTSKLKYSSGILQLDNGTGLVINFDGSTNASVRIGTRNGTILSADAQYSVAVGPDCIASGQRSIAIGFTARATGENSIQLGTAHTSGASSIGIGIGSGASGIDAIAIGEYAVASVHNSVAIGQRAECTGGYIALGPETRAGHSQSIAMMTGITSASNQLVIGSNDFYISDVYIGAGPQGIRFTDGGVTNRNGRSITYHATGGHGTDRAGGNFSIASGKGTGTGTPGYISFSNSAPGVSGSTLQTLSERFRMQGDSLFGFGYGSGNITGTATQNAAFDANGKFIERAFSYGEMYIDDTDPDTIAITSGTPAEGTDWLQGELSNFTYSAGRLTYTGTETAKFHIVWNSSASHTVNATNIEGWLYKNNAEVSKSHSIGTVITAGNIVNIGHSAIVELATNNYIELFYDSSNNGDVIVYTSLISLEKI